MLIQFVLYSNCAVLGQNGTSFYRGLDLIGGLHMYGRVRHLYPIIDKSF